MKHKTLKRVLCFLLALVVVASMPLDIHANAVAVAPWAVYALITYMAAVGITFTVTGGVDAMVKAVQDKVDEYEQTVSLPLPIWVVIEEGTKLVPPPSGGGPNWNPNRGKFFFTANATAAITAFITWLVSDGGWSEGGVIEQDLSFYILENTVVNGDSISVSTSVVDNSDISNPVILQLGTVFLPSVFEKSGVVLDLVDSATTSQLYTFYKNGSYIYSQFTSSSSWDQRGPYYSDVQYYTFGMTKTNNIYRLSWYAILNDGTLKYIQSKNFNLPKNIISLTSHVSADVPVEIPQLQPSTQQGVYIDTSTDAETLEDLAEDIKTQFEETGTIPRPVPEVITDPSVQPTPNPTPTSPTYEDVDDLGLPSLGVALQSKFPFCLPYDLGRVFDIFTAEPVTPYWEVDLLQPLANRVLFVGDTAFVIDFTEYEDLGTISRWMTTIGYCLFLILITRQTTKW